MAINQNFRIAKGRGGTIVTTVEGVEDWTDVKSKLIAAFTYQGTPVIELAGVIDSTENTITFNYSAGHTDDITQRSLHYEVVLYKDDLSMAINSTYGIITVDDVVKMDPTI